MGKTESQKEKDKKSEEKENEEAGQKTDQAPTTETGRKKKPKIEWKTAYDLMQERKDLKRLPTGTAIDDLIGGGIEQAEVIELHGAFGAGKSQIVFTLAVEVAALKDVNKDIGGNVVFIDTESTFKPERLAEIAEHRGYKPRKVLKRISLTQPQTTKEQQLALKAIPKKWKPKLVICDSLTTLYREEYIGRGMLAERQGLIGRFIRDYKNYVRKRKIFGILTNQVYGNPSATPWTPIQEREVAVGGHTVYHKIDNRFHIRKTPSGTRIARLIDSSRYPCPAEGIFWITEAGISSKPPGAQEEEPAEAAKPAPVG